MSTHPLSEMAAAYALGALDERDRDAFEAHLAGCESCRAEVEEYRETTEFLAHAAPPMRPPAALRERIVNEAREVRPITTRVAAPRPRASRAAWLSAAASLLLAVAVGIGYGMERRERLALERTLEEARSRMAARESQLAERDSLLAAVLAPEVRTARLAASGQPPSVQLYLNPGRNLVVISAADLPTAPEGRIYQLWGIEEGGAPVSLGTFDTGAEGRAVVALRVPEGLTPAIGAITEEPAGGSPQPTTTPFLVGTWSG